MALACCFFGFGFLLFARACEDARESARHCVDSDRWESKVVQQAEHKQNQDILIETMSLHRRKARRQRRELTGVGKGSQDCTALRSLSLWCDMIFC